MKSSNGSSYALSIVGDLIDSFTNQCVVTSSNSDGLEFYTYDNLTAKPIKWNDIYWPQFSSVKISADQYSSYPKINHYIESTSLTQFLEIACTGFSEDEIKVVIKNDGIIIRGKKEKDIDGNSTDVKRKDFIREIAMRDFEESFKFGDQYDTDKIVAKLKDGLLRISIPLKEEIKKKNEEKEIKLS